MAKAVPVLNASIGAESESLQFVAQRRRVHSYHPWGGKSRAEEQE